MNIDGTVSGFGLIRNQVTATTLNNATGTVIRNTALDVGADAIEVWSQSFADLGSRVSLAGGTINADNGVAFGLAKRVDGQGTINGRVAAAFGSNISVSGGNLTLGESSSFAGFFSGGEIQIGSNTVTINDRDKAVLGSLTEIGSGGQNGTLTADNGLLLEEGNTLVGQGEVNAANDEFKMQGFVQDDSTGITFNDHVTGGDYYGGTWGLNSSYIGSDTRMPIDPSNPLDGYSVIGIRLVRVGMFPEPSSLLLGLAGIAGLATFGRRRKR